MAIWKEIQSLSTDQRHTFIAGLGGWALDAFDFFLYVFSLRAISQDFQTDIQHVSEGIFLTLAFRPLGALFFGWLAERYGRRLVLMINIVSYSVVECACAFAPSLVVLLVLRALFGFAMGGEWGVGAALVLESLPEKGRGFFSGLLQEGYVLGYLFASIVFAYAFDQIGWRGMFIIGVLPAFLVIYIRSRVPESPAWLRGLAHRRLGIREWKNILVRHGGRLLFLIILMSFFNAFSHGTQDLYPTFLQVQQHFDATLTGKIAIWMNVGALLGGMFFGSLSERLGRRKAIVIAALLALPMIPLWIKSHTIYGFVIGAFLMQFMVQGAWGIVPAHLNELSPASVRAVLPGFAYQIGNLIMSKMAPLQAGLAEHHGNDYAGVLAWTVIIVAVCLAVVTAMGKEAKSIALNVSVEEGQ
ncbi:MAG: MFS transporter [Thermoflavifilum sp.]|nr:MFS transporter [Thermoflavifilum sp.]